MNARQRALNRTGAENAENSTEFPRILCVPAVNAILWGELHPALRKSSRGVLHCARLLNKVVE